jgi:MFS transporter, PPP family, 3-phenylpropionic acid transporter
MKKILPFSFYFVYFAAAAFIQPFVILYFQELGFNGAQIGLLAGLTPLVVMIGAPLWTGLADAKMRHKLIMSLAILISVITAAIFPFIKSFALMISMVVVYALFAAPVTSFADSATMSMLGDQKDMYGRVRMGGTFGWGLVAPLAGLLIEAYGIRWAFWGYSAIMIFTLLICQGFVFPRPGRAEALLSNVRQVFVDQKWILFIALMFVGGVAFTVINSYLFPYMEELNISRSTMGFALFIATASELPVLFFANYLIDRFKAHGLLFIGMIITGLRLILYAVLNFQAGILVFQLINGLTYPLVWVAAVSYANEISPDGMKATAQGLLGASVFGFGAAAGGLVGGILLGAIGGQSTFLAIGIFVLAGVGVITLLERNLHPRQVESSG